MFMQNAENPYFTRGGGTVCLLSESAQIGQNSPAISHYRHTQTGGIMPSGLGVFVLQKNRGKGVKKMKRFIIALAATLILTTQVAANTEIVKVQEYETTNKNEVYQFSENLIENDVEYQLKDVKHEIVSTDTKQKTLTYQKTLGEYSSSLSPEETVTVDGVEYTLNRIIQDTTVITGRTGTYEYSVKYENVLAEPQAPKQLQVSFNDERTNKNVTANVTLQEVVRVSEFQWVDDVQITAKAYPYNSLFYMIGDTKIPHNDQNPTIEGYEPSILAALGLSDTQYILTHAKWNGDVQTDSEGQEFREAVIYGKRYVATYRADYKGENLSLPDMSGTLAVAEYTATLADETTTTYRIKATALYEHKENPITVPLVVGSSSAVVCGIFLIFWFKRKNTLFLHNGKVVYKNRTTNNIVAIPEKILKNKRVDTVIDTIIVKKSYVKHHTGEVIRVISPGLDTQKFIINSQRDLKIKTGPTWTQE